TLRTGSFSYPQCLLYAIISGIDAALAEWWKRWSVITDAFAKFATIPAPRQQNASEFDGCRINHQVLQVTSGLKVLVSQALSRMREINEQIEMWVRSVKPSHLTHALNIRVPILNESNDSELALKDTVERILNQGNQSSSTSHQPTQSLSCLPKSN